MKEGGEVSFTATQRYTFNTRKAGYEFTSFGAKEINVLLFVLIAIMKLLFSSVLCLCCFMELVSSEIGHRHLIAKHVNQCQLRSLDSQFKEVVSKLNCAILCTQNSTCLAFGYANKRCTLFFGNATAISEDNREACPAQVVYTDVLDGFIPSTGPTTESPHESIENAMNQEVMMMNSQLEMSPPFKNASQCPLGYNITHSSFPGIYYKLYRAANFPSSIRAVAKGQCSADGTHLAYIENREKRRFLAALLPLENIHVGLYYDGGLARWSWEPSSALMNASLWAPNEPVPSATFAYLTPDGITSGYLDEEADFICECNS